MSECITAWCLAHRKKVFLQGWGPDAGRWCHLNGFPCEELAPMTVAPPSGGGGGATCTGWSGCATTDASQRRSPDYRPIAKQAIGLLTLFTWRPARSGCVGRQRAISKRARRGHRGGGFTRRH